MGKPKLLLIDDEESLRKLTKLNLERGGKYEVVIAASGAEGLAKARQEAFDLVITDFHMPEMNGDVVLKILKEMNPKLPVILFSIYHDDASTLTPEMEFQADGVISKPIDHQQLKRVIEKALAGREGSTSS